MAATMETRSEIWSNGLYYSSVGVIEFAYSGVWTVIGDLSRFRNARTLPACLPARRFRDGVGRRVFGDIRGSGSSLRSLVWSASPQTLKTLRNILSIYKGTNYNYNYNKVCYTKI